MSQHMRSVMVAPSTHSVGGSNASPCVTFRPSLAPSRESPVLPLADCVRWSLLIFVCSPGLLSSDR